MISYDRGVKGALAALVLSGCGVATPVHCKFVNDVGTASAHYADAAEQAGNAGWKAEASELKKTVDSEKEQYCK